MSFSFEKQAFKAKIREVTVGTGKNAVTFGGQNVLPLYAFDGAIRNVPKVGAELTDLGLEDALPGEKAFYAGCGSVVEMAKRAGTMPGASFLCLRFAGAEPNGPDRSVAECAALAEAVADAAALPLVIRGCGNAEKDSALFTRLSEVLCGKNVLFLSAREENYPAVAAAAKRFGQKLGAESAVDINLAKQLNTMLLQHGADAQSIVMNVGSAAAGYGFEYVASTLERIRLAALAQGDGLLQMPVVTPVSTDVRSVREATVPEDEMPEWGDLEERTVELEIATAAAVLACGSDAVILRHPQAVKTVAQMLDALL